MVNRVDVTFVNEAGWGEQVGGQIATIELLDFVELHVEPLCLEAHLRIAQSINHLRQEAAKASLITTHGQLWIRDHLLNVLFAGIEAKHNDLLDLVFEDFHDG